MPNNHCRYQDVHKLSLVYPLINFRFDLMVGSPCKLYWVLSCVCYTLGLVATFISLYLMNAAQPVSLGFGWVAHYMDWLDYMIYCGNIE